MMTFTLSGTNCGLHNLESKNSFVEHFTSLRKLILRQWLIQKLPIYESYEKIHDKQKIFLFIVSNIKLGYLFLNNRFQNSGSDGSGCSTPQPRLNPILVRDQYFPSQAQLNLRKTNPSPTHLLVGWDSNYLSCTPNTRAQKLTISIASLYCLTHRKRL